MHTYIAITYIYSFLYFIRGKYQWRTWFVALEAFQQTKCLIAMVKRH